jgi:ectoine hydroxylase-related dioxygenase (phytanoyl-CoA dioxygenase family)
VEGSRFARGHADSAAARITLPFPIAHSIFVEGRFRDAMPAYTAGKIQIEGELSALAGIARSDGNELRELRNRLLRITQPASRGPSLSGEAARRASVRAEIDRLGLAEAARQLDVNGYAVVPPEVTGMSVERVDRLRERVLELIAERSGTPPDVETGETHRNVFYPSLYYFLFEDRMFEELLLNEHALAMASYLCGEDCVLSACTVFMKGPADPPKTGSKLQLGLHADNAGWQLPEPYPDPSQSVAVNCTWLLTDYTADDGATVFVPGSHFLRRLPIGFEGEERIVPVEAPRGTLLVWGSNTWHGSLPRMKPGLRLGLAWALTRPFLAAQEPFQQDVTEEILERNPPRFAVLMGQTYPTGWRGEGPERLMESRARAASRRAAKASGRSPS